MKQLRIIVKPFKLDSVLKELAQEEGILITHIDDVKGYTEIREERPSFYRESEFKIDYLPKSYISIICPDSAKERIVEKLENAARTSEVGDGKIFALDVENVIDIGTGSEGDAVFTL